jgi:preprotein translocase subunit SecA
MIRGEVDATFKRHIPPESVEEQWDVPGLESTLASEYQLTAPVGEWLKAEPELDDSALRERIEKLASEAWHGKEAAVGTELMRQFERSLMLQTLDHHWREHLASLDHLRQGIHLRGYAQKNPKQEYKREAFELFSDMLDRIKQDVVRVVLTVQVRSEADVQAVEPEPAVSNVQYQHADYEQALAPNGENGDTAVAVAVAPPFVRAGEKVGRNDPCPCGSGKKYKHCHGRLG